MAVKITDRFASQCSVVYSNNYDTCGTITRSSIEYMTPSQLQDLFAPGGLFADLDAWFRTAIEMKACGTRTYGLYDWIMSGSERTKGKSLLSTQKVARNPSLLFPFILGFQESVINTDYWAVTQGQANSAYTALVTGPLTAADLALGAAADRVIRVVSRYGIDMDPKWFVDRDVVHIFSRSGGIAQDGAWKVLASEVSADLTYVDVLLTSQNAGSSSPYASAPTTGVLVAGLNNVSDFEKWCTNRPNYDGRKEVPFWFQTMRRTRCVDQQYREYFQRLNEPGVNEAFKRFGDLTLAQRNAQDEHEYQKRFVNAFFFNKPVSANQTLALWKSLETISTPSGFSIDPGTGGSIREKRANFIGVKEQLLRCDRVRDLQNNPLNFYEFLDENYRIMRARRSQGRQVTDIDWFTNSPYRGQIMSAFMQYYKDQYLNTLHLNIEVGKTNNLGMIWDSFYVKHPSGVRINIMSHEYFDDLRDANKTESQESIGNVLLCLDMGKPGPQGGTIYWSQIASNRKVHTVGDIEKLAQLDKDFACVMEGITKEITLTSETGTAVVECPSNSLWIWNCSDAVPVTTGETVSYVNLY